MKRTPLRRKPRAATDKVSPELHRAVLARDDGCVARIIDPDSGPCTDGRLTLDHVKDAPRMGVRAPSDMQHLVVVCYTHHIWTGWATSHRKELRDYLAEFS